jgi:hypothetical protein
MTPIPTPSSASNRAPTISRGLRKRARPGDAPRSGGWGSGKRTPRVAVRWLNRTASWKPADEKGDEAQLLPPLHNGETAQLHDPKIEDKETRPPPRYNEGTLIEAMQSLALC